MAKVVKTPRFAVLALLVVLLSAVFLTAPAPPAYAAACDSTTTNCNTWSSISTCCNGGRNQTQKRTCCNSSQTVCCTQTRCNTSLPCST